MKTLARAEDVEEIRARLLALTPEDERRWGSMSVGEMVCHVRDSYEGAIGRRVVLPLGKAAPIPRALYKWLALKLPMQWPHGVETMPEVNPKIGGSRPGEFDADLPWLLERFEKFVKFGGPFPAHPIFGAMTQAEWRRWGYLHADHHLRQFGR